jgi:hypothetical protein
MPGLVAELKAAYERWASTTGRAIPGSARKSRQASPDIS